MRYFFDFQHNNQDFFYSLILEILKTNFFKFFFRFSTDFQFFLFINPPTKAFPQGSIIYSHSSTHLFAKKSICLTYFFDWILPIFSFTKKQLKFWRFWNLKPNQFCLFVQCRKFWLWCHFFCVVLRFLNMKLIPVILPTFKIVAWLKFFLFFLTGVNFFLIFEHFNDFCNFSEKKMKNLRFLNDFWFWYEKFSFLNFCLSFFVIFKNSES